MISNDILSVNSKKRLGGISLRQLMYLVEVSHQKNFRSAARVLAVTQPTLSVQIKKLEETLGVTLIHRKSGEFRLTEAGELFVPRAQSVLERLGKSVDQVLDINDASPLRVGLPAHMNHPMITELLFHFRDEHRNIYPYFAEKPPCVMAEQFLDGILDAVFLSVPTPIQFPGTVRKKTIVTGVYNLCLAKSHPLAKRTIIRADDCSSLKFILFPRAYHVAEFDQQLASIKNLCPDPEIIVSDVVHAQSHVELASAGLGTCLICPGATQLNDQVVLRPTDPMLARNELAVFWNSRIMSPQLERFIASVERNTL